MAGPLQGLRFIEMAGIGPSPFAAMVLADLGAEGIRIDSPRPALSVVPADRDITRRGRASVRIDITRPEGAALVLDLISRADLLVEGYRPGVMERRGLGPRECLAVNPRLVYGRMTGWGQDGPLAHAAGHDLSYIAIAGVLAHIARRGQPPTPPLNIIGDYAGGALFLVIGLLAAAWEAERSGVGQVVDAAMVDGAALLMSLVQSLAASGLWSDEAGANALDSGMPFYDVYRCADGGWLAVACLEPKFYDLWLEGAGLAGADLPAQFDQSGWPVLRERFAEAVARRTRDEWAMVFDGTDACVAPVLTMSEAAAHPHLAARGTYVTVGGVPQAAPAPRFSRTPAADPRPPSAAGADADTALPAWGVEVARIDALRASGVLT
jgi:alpha-methylacyl-CoA racemase